jgi:metacaspase-1
MAIGYTLSIGLNAVDPEHYAGWSGVLNACEADAHDMMGIADSQGFKGTMLLTRAATRKSVVTGVTSAAAKLKKGDIFLLTYSGHGGQVPDTNGDESDAQDETWCLYDGELIDDELDALFAKFAPGVRILVFSDSCHSGTVTREAFLRGTPFEYPRDASGAPMKYRFMPPEVALRTYRENKKFYTQLARPFAGTKAPATVKASVLLFSGCQDNQTSADGTYNGLFTANLLRVWNNGRFKGDYTRFHRDILRRMPPDQSPNLYKTGTADPVFLAQRPFTI